jgi:hypothetical protein
VNNTERKVVDADLEENLVESRIQGNLLTGSQCDLWSPRQFFHSMYAELEAL